VTAKVKGGPCVTHPNFVMKDQCISGSIMAKKTSALAKSETLSIRLDPKTRFILDYLARLRGQTITTVIERAVYAAADGAKIEDDRYYGGELGWTDFWDVSEGVRALKMASHRDFLPTYEEEKRLAFAREHWPFFYASQSCRILINHYVDLLWPRIDELVQLHDDSKANGTDVNAAAKLMTSIIKGAGLEPPQWPPAPKKEVSASQDLDAEIPF